MRQTLRFPGGLRKCVTLSYDDGWESDAELIKIMKENGLKGTFNLFSGAFAPDGKTDHGKNGEYSMPKSWVVKCFENSGMEIASHGYTHPFLEKLSDATCTYELMTDRANLEQIFHRIIRGHAYPFGTYSENVMDIAKKCGYIYARTICSTEGFGLPHEPLAWNPTCHHNNPKLMNLLDSFLADESPEPLLFYLWGHSCEFDSNNNWNVIRDFAKKAGGRSDVWYATNIEIIDYINSYKSLVTSADGTIIYNPTLTDVYFWCGGTAAAENREYVVKSGETIEIATVRR